MSDINEHLGYLSVALSARIVLNTLWGFKDGKTFCQATTEGIEIIAETRRVLKVLTSENCQRIFSENNKRFQSYEQMKMLKEVRDQINWDSWDSDLEQWLSNSDNVKKFFANLETYALHKCNEPL